MNGVSTWLLILTPLLPLVLAVPALRARLPWPCHVALLPALALLAMPADAAVDLPWLLLGSGLALDAGLGRWPLAMAVLVWGAAASLLPAAGGRPVDARLASWFLLTLSGGLGAILATELVGFFSFSVLMGYGFYALLVSGGDVPARRAARVYLVLLIVADLALFEALLMAASTAGETAFEAVRPAMAASPSAALYVAMVLVGFAARAGLWPLHVWLVPLSRSVRPGVVLLLGAVPVATALLGLVRWLPLGDASLPGAGLVVQGMGVAAVLSALVAMARRRGCASWPAWGCVLATGLFAIALGAGLADAAVWGRFGGWAGLFIAAVGLAVALLVAACAWRRTGGVPVAGRADDAPAWFERWAAAAVRRAARLGMETLPRWRAAGLAGAACLWRVRAWRRALDGGERLLQRWACAVILVVLVGIVVALAGASFGGR